VGSWILGRVRNGVREPSVAGIYYEAEPERLKAQLETLFEEAGGSEDCIPRAILVPHAGYIYSGRGAARAYALLKSSNVKPKRIVIVAPIHTGLGSRVSVYPGKAFRTPLGLVRVDEEFSRLIPSSVPGATLDYCAHLYEHSVVVQLPLLQYIYEGEPPPIVAIVAFSDEVEAARRLAGFLAGYSNETLVVATSNLTQFKPYETVRELDKLLLQALEELSFEKLEEAIARGANPCGLSTLNFFIEYSRLIGGKASVIAYATSFDAGGSRDLSVGYAAMRVC